MTATITILTPEEAAQRDQNPEHQRRTEQKRKPERTRMIEAYKAATQGAELGYSADVTLGPNEDKPKVQ